ncbi:MAG: ABC transporter substrate-binding protein [Mariprofundales bacterium]
MQSIASNPHSLTRIVSAGFLCLLFLITTPVLASVDTSNPKIVVQETVDGVIHVLKSRADDKVINQDDRNAMHQVIGSRFDFAEMSKRTLGKYWRRMSSSERKKFTNVFRELLERSYGNRLSDYSGQTVEYGEVEMHGELSKVASLIIDGDTEIPVDYSLLNVENTGWQIYDIRIEDVSMVATYQSSFRAKMKKDGFSGLLKTMQNKLKSLHKEDEVTK